VSRVDRQGETRVGSDVSVDVVINNYNYARFLGAAVESALAQTHRRVNVIVVDDGSTDESRQLLARYDGKVELVLKENGGQASALNAGFLRCRAEVVIFLDADDRLRPGTAALVASTFARNPDVVKVQYRMQVIDDAGRTTGAVKPPAHVPLPQGDFSHAELVFPFDLPWLPTSGNAFRSDALRRIMPIPEGDFASCADWYLVHLTPLLGEVVSLREIGAEYRVHGGNRYEPARSTIDVAHLRQAVVYAAVTTRALTQLASENALRPPYDRILSVADLSNRLVSLKLEPEQHPLPDDRVWSLAIDGIRAALRRPDASPSMKMLFGGWFITTAIAPHALARRLAAYFIFPERRRAMNLLLRRLHRKAEPTPPARADVPVSTIVPGS
jgi:glycosyltransferase involved in cell wall biosynthesis